MAAIRKLKAEELCKKFDPKNFKFTDTRKVKSGLQVIGQKKVVEQLRFALNVQGKGNNIYFTACPGFGAEKLLAEVLAEEAKTMKATSDWCYVNNFDNPEKPIAIRMPAGKAVTFQEEMENFIKFVVNDLQSMKTDNKLTIKELEIDQKVDQTLEDEFKVLQEYAKTLEIGVAINKNNGKIKISPFDVDGKIVDSKGFDKLDEKVKKSFEMQSNFVLSRCNEYLRNSTLLERKAEEEKAELEEQWAKQFMEDYLVDMRKKYKSIPKIIQFLDAVVEDILDEIDIFIEGPKPSKAAGNDIVSIISRDPFESAILYYGVNVLVDNSEKAVPIVFADGANFVNLLGNIETIRSLVGESSDYTCIKAGDLHKANGGFLVINVMDLLTNPGAWEALIDTLKFGRIKIIDYYEQTGIEKSHLQPETIPSDLRVILYGDSQYYHLLYEHDENFAQLFKLRINMEHEMNYTDENADEIFRFISNYCKENKILPFDREGVGAVVDYACALAENQEKLTTNINALEILINEAVAWAKVGKSKIVTGNFVKKAIEERRNRTHKVVANYLEIMKNDIIKVDTAGYVIGQVNALAVYQSSDVRFGMPSKVTVATFAGQKGLINIEKEVDMSGPIHSKGVCIVSGFLGSKYAQKKPMAITASIAFEQLYDGIEGDSASSTELYAILSSLSGLPINQGIAVTGSVNQRGEVQAIGGVNDKVEGFYEVCKMKGFTGKQGVMIPESNISDLALTDEIIEAVKDGKFTIYAVKTIDEGIEVLTGRSSKEVDRLVTAKIGKLSGHKKKKVTKTVKKDETLKKK